jgi:protease-4
MDKIGLSVDVSKSGENKDMGSPFRKDTEQEEKIFSELINTLNNHFYSLVSSHRNIKAEHIDKIKSARVFLANEALELGLIDAIGYPDDAAALCRNEAGLGASSMLVVYRRKNYPNDNIYNASQVRSESPLSLVNLGPLSNMPSLKPGFYYLWGGALGL